MSINNIFICAIMLMAGLSKGQPLLEKEVSFEHIEAKAKVVFNDISVQTGAIFSYSDFDDEKRITIRVNKMKLNKVVAQLESDLNIRILVKDKYLIIRPISGKQQVEILGTVTDPNTNEPLSDASVYVRKNRMLVNTNTKGQFVLNVPADFSRIKVNIAKKNYADTAVILVASKDQYIQIHLRSFPRKLIAAYDTLPKKEIQIGSIIPPKEPELPPVRPMSYNENFWQKMRTKHVHLININDTIFNRFSISLLPPVSTNKLLSFHTRNIISINVIGGNAKGLNGMELGGVYNYDDGNVAGLQVAGVVNAVSENVRGVQISGVFNGVKGRVSGLQAAGVLNLNDNLSTGIQIAGAYQQTHTLFGLQIAGLYNRAIKVKGAQISGCINVADSATTNFQVAGLVNKAGNVQGIQISGLVNRCDTLEGVQIGLFNSASYIKRGLAIGLFNKVPNGYHKMETSLNELGTVSVGLRSGWAPLHLHYFVGFNGKDKEFQFVQGGLGIATSVPLHKNWNFEADLNSRSSHSVEDITHVKFNVYNQLMAGISWQPGKKIGFRTGLSINHFWYKPDAVINDKLAAMITNPVYTRQDAGISHKVWFGWHVGLLLF